MVLVVFALSSILDGLYLAYVAQILQKCHLCVSDLIFGGYWSRGDDPSNTVPDSTLYAIFYTSNSSNISLFVPAVTT